MNKKEIGEFSQVEIDKTNKILKNKKMKLLKKSDAKMDDKEKKPASDKLKMIKEVQTNTSSIREQIETSLSTITPAIKQFSSMKHILPIKHIETISSAITSSIRHIPSNILSIPSFEGKHKSVQTEIEKLVNKEKNNISTYAEKCSVCNKSIKNFQYWSLRKLDYDELKEPKLIECNNFCSTKCLDEFKKNNSDKLEKYEFYEINRCSCYYDCKELNNLRYMCEKEKILNYEPGAFFCNIQPKNFCEPANASIIKASINIHKEVKNLKKETTFQFKLTAAMTILVIILTLANIWIAAQNDTATKIDELRMDLSTIYSSVNDSLDKYNIKIDETNNHLKNIDEYFQGNRNNNET